MGNSKQPDLPPDTVVVRPRKPVPLIIGAAFVSFASTLLGIGGGALVVPLLATWGGTRLKRSVATSLALIAVVVTVGLVVQVWRAPEDILWGEAGLIVAGAFVGAPIGRWLLKIIPRAVFRYVLAVFLILVAIRMIGLVPNATHLVGDSPDIGLPATWIFAFVVGFIAGLSSTLFGIGGGIVIVPALTIGYSELAEHFNIARATSLAAIVPISVWGTFLHARKGNVEFKLIPMLLPLSLVFAVGGVIAAYWLHAEYLTVVFAVVLAVMAVKLVMEARSIAKEDKAKRV
ncbi:MAG: sulfite exporter TauE/SafE family protein [Planctomycetes bacterium]|nr:sulfite exporter TauE/SafE family protein [Planctomycetota bacterium]